MYQTSSSEIGGGVIEEREWDPKKRARISRAQREAEAEAREARRQAEIPRELARLEAKFPGLKAQYEASRANGAPNDTVRAAPPRSERGARGARARL